MASVWRLVWGETRGIRGRSELVRISTLLKSWTASAILDIASLPGSALIIFSRSATYPQGWKMGNACEIESELE